MPVQRASGAGGLGECVVLEESDLGGPEHLRGPATEPSIERNLSVVGLVAPQVEQERDVAPCGLVDTAIAIGPQIGIQQIGGLLAAAVHHRPESLEVAVVEDPAQAEESVRGEGFDLIAAERVGAHRCR